MLIGLDTEGVTMCHSVWAEEEMMEQRVLTYSFFKRHMYISRRVYSKMFTTVILLDYEVASSSSRGLQLLWVRKMNEVIKGIPFGREEVKQRLFADDIT